MLGMFHHFVGLALKGLSVNLWNLFKIAKITDYKFQKVSQVLLFKNESNV